MSNWALPTLTSTYTNFLSEVSARIDDAGKMSRSDTVTLTSPPVGHTRWNTSTSRWETNTGTVGVPVWTVLASTYGINVSTANAWSTGRTVGVSGDAAGTSAAWTGSGNISFAVALAVVNGNVGAFGSAAAVPIITVNAKGLVTAVSTAALGTMATQAATAVAIIGGAVSGVTFTVKAGTGPTAEGVMEWSTTGDLLMVGTGAATKVMVDTNSTQTLTNKTLTSPTLGGTPLTPTAVAGTATTQIASTAHVFAERANTITLTNKTINLASNTLTMTKAQLNTAVSDATIASAGANTDITSLNAPALGAATATTQAVDDPSTKVATDQFVLNQAASATPAAASGTGVVGVSTRFARGDHAHPAAVGLGIGQSWSSVTITNGATNTNSSGKPIVTSAYATNNVTSTSCSVAVGGLTVADSLFSVSQAIGKSTCSAVVPNGATYVWTISGPHLFRELS
jgi:hypothetical protein